MIDSNLVFRRAVADTTVDHRGTVTSNAATANLTHATYTSSFLDLTASQVGLPQDGMDLVLVYSASGFTSTGAAGSSITTWTVEFSDDNSTVVSSQIAMTVSATFASSASAAITVNGVAYTLPQILRVPLAGNQHRYVRVKATTALTTITAADYGAIGAHLEDGKDSSLTYAG